MTTFRTAPLLLGLSSLLLLPSAAQQQADGFLRRAPSRQGSPEEKQHFPVSRRRSSEPLFDEPARRHRQRQRGHDHRQRRAQDLKTYKVDGELVVPFAASAFDVIAFADFTSGNDNGDAPEECSFLAPLEAKLVDDDDACEAVSRCTVGPTTAAEWLGYLVRLPRQSDNTRFDVTVRAASSTNGNILRQFKMEILGPDNFVETSEVFTVVNDGNYRDYRFTPTFSSAFDYRLKVTFVNGPIDMCSLTADLSGAPVPQRASVPSVGETIVAIDSYADFADTTPSHLGDCSTIDDVRGSVDGLLVPSDDLCATRDAASCAVAFTEPDEFVVYNFSTSSVASTRTYVLRIRAMAERDDVRIRIDAPNQAFILLPSPEFNDIDVPLTLNPGTAFDVRLTFLDGGVRVCSLRLDAVGDVGDDSIPSIPATIPAIDYVGFQLRDPDEPRIGDASCSAVPGPMAVGSVAGNDCNEDCYLVGTRSSDVLVYHFRTSDDDDSDNTKAQITIRMATDDVKPRNIKATINGDTTRVYRFVGPRNGLARFEDVSVEVDNLDPDQPVQSLRLELQSRRIQICNIAVNE